MDCLIDVDSVEGEGGCGTGERCGRSESEDAGKSAGSVDVIVTNIFCVFLGSAVKVRLVNMV